MTGVASLSLTKQNWLNEFSHGKYLALCLKVRNPSAVNSDWTAVVMITDQSQDDSDTRLHLTVPSYDDFQTDKICGETDIITGD